MYIDGIGFNGYRSFGNQLQEIGPFAKINLIIGQNNSGKSNILTFLTNHYRNILEAIRSGGSWSYALLDRHIGQENVVTAFSLCIPIKGDRYNSIISNCPDISRETMVERLFRSNTLSRGGDCAWFRYLSDASITKQRIDPKLVEEIKAEAILRPRDWIALYEGLIRIGVGRDSDFKIPETLDYFARQVADGIPKIDLIPAIRRIGDSGSTSDDFSGVGIIDRLAQLQNPKHNEQHKKRHFQDINDFVRKVVGNATALLEIPYERDMILVHMDNKSLPLSSLGTGIHEVIILAAAATVLRQQVLCIEEPELHLHPLLQKKLVRYLHDKTDNQYFFSTHSAHLLDTPGAAIFHVQHQDGASTVELVHTSAKKALVCADLGYRASDLLQANCVIWVEGPSDRLYLNHWLRAVDSSLVEGLHYSIMFYGGRLLDHLTADDQEVTDFISLRRLNRNVAIIIDSDMSSSTSPLNETKERVCREVRENSGFVWITNGREIENYVTPEILRQMIEQLYPRSQATSAMLRYSDCLTIKGPRSTKKQEADKIKVATLVVSQPPDLKRFDLEQRVKALAQFIRNANTDK